MYDNIPFAVTDLLMELACSEPDWFQIKLFTCTSTGTQQVLVYSSKLCAQDHTDWQRWNSSKCERFLFRRESSQSQTKTRSMWISQELHKRIVVSTLAFESRWKKPALIFCQSLRTDKVNTVVLISLVTGLNHKSATRGSLFCVCTIQKPNNSRHSEPMQTAYTSLTIKEHQTHLEREVFASI